MAVSSRRAFLERALWAGAASTAVGLVPGASAEAGPERDPGSAPLLLRFPDLKRPFL